MTLDSDRPVRASLLGWRGWHQAVGFSELREVRGTARGMRQYGEG